MFENSPRTVKLPEFTAPETFEVSKFVMDTFFLSGQKVILCAILNFAGPQYFGTQFEIESLDAKNFNSTSQQKVSSFILCSKNFSQKFPFSAILTQTFDLLIVAMIFDYL